MKFLKNHPFAVQAFFENSLVLTFAVPKEYLEGFLPPHLALDTFQNKWAFIAIAMVQTKDLRPKGFPEFLGNNFFLIGYRIFVRYKSRSGKNLRGLYIIKSETDKPKMKFFGNIFTHYNYTTTDIKQQNIDNQRVIKSNKSQFYIITTSSPQEIPLPTNSPFSNWKEARKFAGPLPHTFTYNEEEKKMLIILGIRKNWKPKPVKVLKYNFQFLNELELPNLVLANAFEITNIPYHWEKGKVEIWK